MSLDKPSEFKFKRISILAGHYGSGKTNIAVNLALHRKKSEASVTIADLDIVNPYYRTKDSANLLKQNGITLVSSEYANTNVDVPVLGAEIQRVFPLVERNPDATVIFDLGGDNGAVALGRFYAEFTRLGYTMLLVENRYRPLTETAEAMLENLREIEYYSRLRCSAIINNSNLGDETTAEDIIAAESTMEEFSRISALPLACTTVCAPLAADDPTLASLHTPLWQIRNYIRRMF